MECLLNLSLILILRGNQIMNTSIVKLANDFSSGRFESVFPFLSDTITWKIIGDNTFIGKSDVISHCKQVAEYFNSVDTKFTIIDSITDNSKVVIIGTAEFLRDGKHTNFVEASDFYEFNNDGMLTKIASYCISEK
jgi:hypothetical protein